MTGPGESEFQASDTGEQAHDAVPSSAVSLESIAARSRHSSGEGHYSMGGYLLRPS